VTQLFTCEITVWRLGRGRHVRAFACEYHQQPVKRVPKQVIVLYPKSPRLMLLRACMQLLSVVQSRQKEESEALRLLCKQMRLCQHTGQMHIEAWRLAIATCKLSITTSVSVSKTNLAQKTLKCQSHLLIYDAQRKWVYPTPSLK
jgi:hypothetical protein